MLSFLIGIGFVVGAGLAVAKAVEPQPPAALAGCHLARQLAPRTYVSSPPMCVDLSRSYTAGIHTSRGLISIKTDANTSDPVTVNNFLVLASHGFYNGMAFFNVQSWAVQSGDPLGNGRGGPGYVLPDEPSKSPWVAGEVGMARVRGGAVNGSQFFILKDQWPGGGPKDVTYNQFATVTRGLDVLGTLTASDRIVYIEVKPG